LPGRVLAYGKDTTQILPGLVLAYGSEGKLTLTNSLPTTATTVGLLAGWGRYPVLIAQALREQGIRVACVGIKDHADPELKSICHDYFPAGGLRFGAHIRYFRRLGVKQATMAGKVNKTILFSPLKMMQHFPDWTCIETFYPHYVTKAVDKNDDAMLMAIVNTYAKRDIEFLPATDFVPELLVKCGTLTGRLSRSQELDIQFGWRLAKESGRLDIGQSVAVKGRLVIAVEAIEGTDMCIRRAGELCSSGGFTVVKVAKPEQDMRFDVPTIGVGTIRTMAEAGGKLLAIEAGKTIIIDQPEVIAEARRCRITVVAVDAADAETLGNDASEAA
jgi:DUF1009 family protein